MYKHAFISMVGGGWMDGYQIWFKDCYSQSKNEVDIFHQKIAQNFDRLELVPCGKILI